MQRYLLNHLNNAEFIILLTCIILTLAFTLSFLSKKYLGKFISYDNNRFVGYFLGSISANYGFILGFIIVTLWKELYEVKAFVMQEAEYLSLLVYNMSAFPLSTQNEIMNGIEQYIKIIIQEEWPLMRLGQVSEKTIPTLSKLFHIIQSYSPETKVESAFYNQFISNLNKVIEFRRRRFEYLDSSLSDVMRFMLIFGVLVILSLISLLDSQSQKIKILAITLASSMLSLNLSLALLLDYPFTGSNSTFVVSSDPFKKGILEQFNSKK
jgi:hypothetical protein